MLTDSLFHILFIYPSNLNIYTYIYVDFLHVDKYFMKKKICVEDVKNLLYENNPASECGLYPSGLQVDECQLCQQINWRQLSLPQQINRVSRQ